MDLANAWSGWVARALANASMLNRVETLDCIFGM